MNGKKPFIPKVIAIALRASRYDWVKEYRDKMRGNLGV
jgi:hypothetical protein